ncbi:MAG: hypothetical protein JWO55_795 [Candidatus Saccharibacteria bacterium]|nr:hypothetical protein [Candidatus Saccharibacteria bacterium]
MSQNVVELTQREYPEKQAFSPPEKPSRAPSLGDGEVDQTAKVVSERAHVLRLVNGVEDALKALRNDSLELYSFDESRDEGPEDVAATVKSVAQRIVHLFNPTSANDVLFRPEQAKLQRQIELEVAYAELAYILQLLKGMKRTIVVMASKGGAGKTPLITNLAVLHSWLATVANLLLEGNENDGTVNLRLDLRRSEQSLLNDVLADHDLIIDHETACENLGKHKQTSVYALLSDPNTTNNKFTMEEFLSMHQTLRPKYRNCFGDTGNGNSHAANEGLFLEADVVLFPAVADDMATFNTLLSTMINLYQLNHIDKLQKHSFVVINGTHEGNTVGKFLQRFHSVATELVAAQIDHKTKEKKPPYWTDDPTQLLRDLGFDYDEERKEFTGKKIYMVPFSQWIRDGKPASVLPEETGLETLVAYARILVDCFKQEVPTLEQKKYHVNRRLRERDEPSTLVKATPATAENLLIKRLIRALEGADTTPGLQAQIEEVASTVAKRELREMLNPAS